jgi:hypothetical protein
MNSSTTTCSTTRRLTGATALVGTMTATALLGFSSPGSALAPGTSQQPERQCFIEQPHWNVALDGPVPRCPVATSTTPDGAPAPAPGWATGQGEVAWVGGLARQ